MKSLISVVALTACIDSADAPPSGLHVEPEALTVTVVDGQPVVAPFIATVVDSDGFTRDVTAETRFALSDDAYGTWDGASLTVTGAALGPTHVVATFADMKAGADVTVFARVSHVGDAAPTAAPMMFATANRDYACAPAISYPARNVIVPRDLPDFEVHWADATDDLFEVSLSTTYLEVRVYTKDAWTTVPDWQRLADQHEPVTMHVTGMVEASPDTACTGSTQHAYIADQGFVGGVYWVGTYGMMRYSVATGTANSLFPPATVNVSVGATTPRCTGCALSSDGARIAIGGEIYDFTTDTGWTPTNGTNPRSWTGATFDPIGAKLVIAHDDMLELMTVAGTSLAMISGSGVARDPQLSPDGTMLANIESFTTGDAIVVRTFDNATNTFGDEQTVGLVETGVTYAGPAWSPDGQWLAYTRTSGSVSSIWVVTVDGSRPPIQVTLPSADSAARARWAPVHHTFGPAHFFYLAFDSTQPFGQRLAAGTRQLWVLPFFPAAGTIGPAFHLPMQWLVETQLVEWTTGVVD